MGYYHYSLLIGVRYPLSFPHPVNSHTRQTIERSRACIDSFSSYMLARPPVDRLRPVWRHCINTRRPPPRPRPSNLHQQRCLFALSRHRSRDTAFALSPSPPPPQCIPLALSHSHRSPHPLFARVRKLVDSDTEDHLAPCSRHHAAHPAPRKWFGVRLSVARLYKKKRARNAKKAGFKEEGSTERGEEARGRGGGVHTHLLFALVA